MAADHKVYGNLIVDGEITLNGGVVSDVQLGNDDSAGDFHTISVKGSATDRGIDLVLKGDGYLRVPEGYELAIANDDRGVANKKYADTKIGGHDTDMTDPEANALLFRDHSDDTIKFVTLHESLEVDSGSVKVANNKTIQKVAVRKNSGVSNVGARSRLHFIEGTNVTLDITDSEENDEVTVKINASGGGGSGDANVNVISDTDEFDVVASGVYIYSFNFAGIANVVNASNTGRHFIIKNISGHNLLVRSAVPDQIYGVEPSTFIILQHGMVVELVADGTYLQILRS